MIRRKDRCDELAARSSLIRSADNSRADILEGRPRRSFGLRQRFFWFFRFFRCFCAGSPATEWEDVSRSSNSSSSSAIV